MTKKRVLLLSEGFGAGHTQAAHALSSSLRRLSPHVQTKVMELGTFLNPRMAPWIITAYKKTLTSQPRLVGMVYRHQYKKSLNRLTTMALHRLFYTHTRSIIRQLRPDMIVCTHPIPSAVISRLKRLGLNVPLCTVITDYDAHGTWITPEVDKYFVSTPEVLRKLRTRGVPFMKIQVTGIPVHPDFWEHPSHEEIREQFGLKAIPTVLVMGGGWGMLDDTQLHDFISRWKKDIQIIFCLGNNHKMLRKLQQDSRYKHPHIHLLGFTREIDKLMEVSDLLITKPGGMTCSEGLAKGIPMLFHNPLPGQEEENSQYFTALGLGETITSTDVIVKWMNRMVHHYPEVQQKRKAQAARIAMYHPLESAQSIIDMLERSQQGVIH